MTGTPPEWPETRPPAGPDRPSRPRESPAAKRLSKPGPKHGRMTPVPPAIVGRLVRDLDAAEFRAFVADLWTARGFEVSRPREAAPGGPDSPGADDAVPDGDLLVARDGDDERRLLVVPAGTDASETVPPDADAVIVADRLVDPPRGVVDADDLRGMLLYAIDRPTARRLFESHFDRPLVDPESNGSGSPTDPQNGESGRDDGASRWPAVPRVRRPDRVGAPEVVGLAVVAVVLLAAVATGLPAGLTQAGPADGATDDGADGSTATDTASTDTATPRPRGTTGVTGAPPLVRARIDGGSERSERATPTRSPRDGAGSDSDSDSDPVRAAGGAGPPLAVETREGDENATGPGADRPAVDPERLPPGVGTDGSVAAGRLAAAHARALTNASYRVTLTHREFVGDRPSGLAREVIRVENDTNFRTQVRTVGRLRVDPQVIEARAQYADGSDIHVRGRQPRTGWGSLFTAVSGNPIADRLYNYVRWFLSVDTVRVVRASAGGPAADGAGAGQRVGLATSAPEAAGGTNGTGSGDAVNATGRTATAGDLAAGETDPPDQYWLLFADDPYGGVENVTGAALVDESGLVREIHRRYRYPGRPGVAAAVSIRVSGLGETTVKPPAWYRAQADRNRTRTGNATADGRAANGTFVGGVNRSAALASPARVPA